MIGTCQDERKCKFTWVNKVGTNILKHKIDAMGQNYGWKKLNLKTVHFAQK